MQKLHLKSGFSVAILFSLLSIIPHLIRVESSDLIDLAALMASTIIFTLIMWSICISFLKAKEQFPNIVIRWVLLSICGTVFAYFYTNLSSDLIKFIGDESSNINHLLQLNHRQLFYMNIFRSFVVTQMVCFIVYNLSLIEDRQRKEIEIEQLKQENLEARLELLKQQISPHFLFNSLSTLKTIVTDNKSKNFIVQLSNVYRYLLSNNILQKDNLVSLQEELAFTKSYLYILTERFEEALQISIEVDEKFMNKRLPPLALQILIENATKHNTISVEEPLKIAIYTEKDNFLVVENNLQLKNSVEDSLGLGIKNIQDRYRLLKNKEIIISQTRTSFLVKLPLLDEEIIKKQDSAAKPKHHFSRGNGSKCF